jgi:hypothetical protein
MPTKDISKDDLVAAIVRLERGNFSAPPAVCKLLRAVAGNTDAHRYRYDTILIAAVETIEAFERAEEPNYLHAGVTNF